MERYLRSLLAGMAQVMDLAPEQRSYQLDTQGFVTDAKRLRGDFVAVGNDMRKAIRREQAGKRTH